MVRLYGNDRPVERFAESHRRIYEQVEEIWTRCLELGLDVVLDFGLTRRERDATRRKISGYSCSGVSLPANLPRR